MIKKINPRLVKENISDKPQKWCMLSYPGHKEGCPNLSKKRSLKGIRKDLQSRVIRECPKIKKPQIRLLNQIFDLSKPIYVIYQLFNIGAYAEEMRTKQNKLKTRGQWYNSRYWQPVARKGLYKKIEKFLDTHDGTIVDICPEAHGINFCLLMPKINIKLKWFKEWPPEHETKKKGYLKNKEYQICLAGYPKKTFKS